MKKMLTAVAVAALAILSVVSVRAQNLVEVYDAYGIGKVNLSLNSGGSKYGQIFNSGTTNQWSLGSGTDRHASGSAALSWNGDGVVTMNGTFVPPSITTSALAAGNFPAGSTYRVFDANGNYLSNCVVTGPGTSVLASDSAVACDNNAFAAPSFNSLLGGTTGYGPMSAGGGAFTCVTSSITGNVGASGGFSYSGCVVTGSSVAVTTAQNLTDFAAATTTLAAQSCGSTLSGTLAGITLTPGTYCFTSAAALTGTLTLNGPTNSQFLIRVGSGGSGALSATSFNVYMSGGAQAKNVYWQVTDAATLTSSNFLGNILAGGAITTTSSNITGRLLATGAISVTSTVLIRPQ